MNDLQNKTLARRLLEVVVNRRQVESISKLIAPGLLDRTSGLHGVKSYRQHGGTFLNCYPDIRVRMGGQVAITAGGDFCPWPFPSTPL